MAAPTVLTCPNHDARPAGLPIDMLVLHYTGMPNGAAAMTRLRDASAKVSAHYLIEEDGRVFQLVPEERRAWHAGAAYWRGHRDINGRSIGIELVNLNDGKDPFPGAQLDALRELLRDIVSRHPIRHIIPHYECAIPPGRKSDPAGFDESWFRGILPESPPPKFRSI